MSALVSTLIIIVCLILILVVLVQNSKGGGLASGFASNNQVMGVRKTTDILDKATWGFAIALFVLCLLAAPSSQAGAGNEESKSVTKEKAEGMSLPAPAKPVAPANPAPTAPAEKK